MEKQSKSNCWYNFRRNSWKFWIEQKIKSIIYKRSDKEVIEKQNNEKEMSEKINHIIGLLNAFLETILKLLKKYKMKKNEDKVMVKNIIDIFFEDEEDIS